MKKDIVIGLMGAILNNGNMGCVALTYSVIKACEIAAGELGINTKYAIFESNVNRSKVTKMCKALELEESKIISVELGYIHKFTSCVKYAARNKNMINQIKLCDCVIDLTQGDSFTDSYGDERFMQFTKIKEKIETYGIPLILGPQTYGPFEKKKNRDYAKKIIENASCVISRDEKSAEYIKSFSDRDVIVTTDFAFLLPYTKTEKCQTEKVKVGFNISSLLIKNKLESTDSKFVLSLDYDEYVRALLDRLCKDEKYEVHLIPHVGEDAGYLFAEEYPNAIVHKAFETPIDAKNCISQMDVFVGARMHATVAAFSTGVATIPTAYSRKFSGLYNNLGYDYVVDMQSMDNETAIKCTCDYIDRYLELQKASHESMQSIKKLGEKTNQVLKDQFIKL